MLDAGDTRTFAWASSGRALALVWAPIAIVTAAHYAAHPGHDWVHDVLRRLYYIPIVLGAFSFGLRGALAASIVTSIAYAPHAFLHVHHQDPGRTIEKGLEILLYNVIALITGVLADRQRRGRLEQEAVARRLAESLEDLKLMEEQLVRAGKLRALGELTAGLAHEIRNPLASLKGAVEIVSDEIPAASPRRRMVDILDREIDRLAALLERFLAFARPQPVHVGDVPVQDLLDAAAALVEPQAAKTGVRVDRHGDGAGLVARGDRTSLSLVLTNVLINATQAMPGGGAVTLRAGMETRRKRDFCVVTVEDTGPGVPDDLKERVFDPFVTTKEGGVGLGLSIAARVVDAHDGFIEVRDRPGGGAAFRIGIPAAAKR